MNPLYGTHFCFSHIVFLVLLPKYRNNSLQESIESETDHGIADEDPNIELEKELISKKIPESAAFIEGINHLVAVIDYIDNTQLDGRTKMLLDIELLKVRR